jgi:hypothetical protein
MIATCMSNVLDRFVMNAIVPAGSGCDEPPPEPEPLPLPEPEPEPEPEPLPLPLPEPIPSSPWGRATHAVNIDIKIAFFIMLTGASTGDRSQRRRTAAKL